MKTQMTPYSSLVATAALLRKHLPMDSLVSPHISVREMACGHGDCKFCGGTVFVSPVLIDLYERIRAAVGRPIVVNSGYRCQQHNEEIGGEDASRHVIGVAADLSLPAGMSIAEFGEICKREVLQVRGGMGRYPNFIHVDVWPWPPDRRW